MTPLFWRCEYAALVGGGTQVVGIETDGVLSQNICAEKHPDAHKSLILYQPSDTKIYVPGKATFGGIWTWPVSDDHFSVVKKSIDGFLQEFESIPVEVHMPPDYFFPEVFQPQHQALLDMGGFVLHSDTSYHIDLNLWSAQNMSKGNRKKLRQCQELNLRTTRLTGSDIESVYALIEANRLAIGVVPSVSLGQMLKMFYEMPKTYEFFGTFLSESLIAAAVTVLITDKIRYVFMWADEGNYRTLSPVVALCDGIIGYSVEAGNSILDLGTASEFGELNQGLARFKTNLGAIATAKRTYSITRCK